MKSFRSFPRLFHEIYRVRNSFSHCFLGTKQKDLPRNFSASFSNTCTFYPFSAQSLLNMSDWTMQPYWRRTYGHQLEMTFVNVLSAQNSAPKSLNWRLNPSKRYFKWFYDRILSRPNRPLISYPKQVGVCLTNKPRRLCLQL